MPNKMICIGGPKHGKEIEMDNRDSYTIPTVESLNYTDVISNKINWVPISIKEDRYRREKFGIVNKLKTRTEITEIHVLIHESFSTNDAFDFWKNEM